MYPDFARWAAWGEELMAMHIGYEEVEPWPLDRLDRPDPKRATGTAPKPVLRSDPELGLVPWGEALMAMHIGYEQVEPWPLDRLDRPDPKRATGTALKPILRSDPDLGLVRVDADTQLSGIPRRAWDYRLGNRSAIDWVLDQHKEKKPRDPTIAARFDTYRLADHKEAMIALLARVVRVSIDTVAITDAMRALPRPSAP